MHSYLVMTADLDTLIRYAVRYAVGRKTYAAQELCDIVREHKASLTDQTVLSIRKEILEREEIGQLGDVDDENAWMKLAADMAR